MLFINQKMHIHEDIRFVDKCSEMSYVNEFEMSYLNKYSWIINNYDKLETKLLQ